MKKLVSMLMACVLALSLSACSKGGDEGSKKVLRVFNVGEYMQLDLIEAFEKEYNCEVKYETYESNEIMYTKLVAGGNNYDIVFPSDYMMDQLIREDLVQEINWDLITNKDEIDPNIQGQEFDPENKYWVPYFYGNVGIVYDKTKVSEEDLKDGWNILKNTKYKGDIYMYDSVRDGFMIALKALGYSMNTTVDEEINAAYDWLVEQRETMDPVYVTDTVIDAMANGDKAMGVVYSGDAAYILSENEDMGFYLPEEGTNYWVDGMMITKNCTETELANQFINFLCNPDNALENTLEVGYYSPIMKASEGASEDYEGNNAYSIRFGEKDEIFKYHDQETKTKYNDLWTKVIAK